MKNTYKKIQIFYKIKYRYVIIGAIISSLIFALFGTVTAIIPSDIFRRMIPVTIFDYVFLLATSAMLGAYLSLSLYKKSNAKAENNYAAAGGGVLGIFAFGCPICNAVIVSLIGTTAILTFYEPVRPLIGILGIIALSFALYMKIKSIKCKKCRKE